MVCRVRCPGCSRLRACLRGVVSGSTFGLMLLRGDPQARCLLQLRTFACEELFRLTARQHCQSPSLFLQPSVCPVNSQIASPNHKGISLPCATYLNTKTRNSCNGTSPCSAELAARRDTRVLPFGGGRPRPRASCCQPQPAAQPSSLQRHPLVTLGWTFQGYQELCVLQPFHKFPP